MSKNASSFVLWAWGRFFSVAECRYESPIAILVQRAFAKCPYPKIIPIISNAGINSLLSEII
jgi:hypothetical protein